jgi:uncharacterized protein (DUF58 family)
MSKENIEDIRLEQYGSLEFYAKQVVEGFITGLHKSPYHGFSVEFAEHRQYNKGESTRHIDWKLYARTDKLFVKRFEEETNLRCMLVLDASSSMHYPKKTGFDFQNLNKLQFSIVASAVLMNIFKRQRDAVGLSVYADKVETLTLSRSSAMHHKLLFHEMEQVLDGMYGERLMTTSTPASLHEIAEKVHQRSLIILFSDMFDRSGANDEEFFSALQHLKYNKHEVILFHVVDRKHEVEFEFENRPYRFIDMETGEQVKLNPSEIKEEYARRVMEFEKELKLRCSQYHIDMVEADVNSGFDNILLTYLLKRQRLY